MEDVELRRRRGVPDVRRAAHEHDPPDAARPPRGRYAAAARCWSSEPVGPASPDRSPGRRRRSRSTSRSSSTACWPPGWLGRAGPPEVTHPVLAVHVPRVDRRREQGRAAPAATGTSSRPHVWSTLRVLRTTSASGALPPDTGDRLQLESRVQGCQQQGTGVIHARVDVEDDRRTRKRAHGASLETASRGKPVTQISPSSLTASRSSASSLVEASILVREKSLMSSPWTISQSPLLVVTGNEEIRPSGTS